MLSDVISDALVQIADYQERQPEVYKRFKTEIAETKAAMKKLIKILDEPPIEERDL